MDKVTWHGGALIAPVPAVMVSCGDMESSNIITVAWCGITNTVPPKTYVSIRPSRFSYNIIKEAKEFVINLTPAALAKKADLCGIYTGKKVDKFQKCGFSKERASVVSAPMIGECPISIECKVTDISPLGSHDMFLADVVGIEADERYIDPETGRFSLESARPIVYSHGEYYTLGELIGHFGWSVRKPIKRAKRRAKQSKKTTK